MKISNFGSDPTPLSPTSKDGKVETTFIAVCVVKTHLPIFAIKDGNIFHDSNPPPPLMVVSLNKEKQVKPE